MIVKVRVEAPALDGTKVRIVVLSDADDVLSDIYDDDLRSAVVATINRFREVQQAAIDAIERLGFHIRTGSTPADGVPELLS